MVINEKLYRGYNPSFFIDDIIEADIPIPSIGKKNQNDIAPIIDNSASILNYQNFCLQLSARRKFPFFTGSNIDGALFKKAARTAGWKKDLRAKDYQFGLELYNAEMGDFDRGHMTRREDVQWGETIGLAQSAADSTFFYPNAVPQHRKLNQRLWKSLEDYILHTETRKKSLKVCVFTGPVLSNNDPIFITLVKGENIALPVLFWKIVFYPKEDGKIYRVGFLISQKKLFVEDRIIEELESVSSEDELFMQFYDAETYQVNVSLIEQITNLKFSAAIDSYKDTRNRRLIFKEVEIDPELESNSLEQMLGFDIINIQL